MTHPKLNIKIFKLSNKGWFSKIEDAMICLLTSDSLSDPRMYESYKARVATPFGWDPENIHMSDDSIRDITRDFNRRGFLVCDTRDFLCRDGRGYVGALGNAFSYFIFEEKGKNWMAIFDSGDGSGSHPDSCHIEEERLMQLVRIFDVEGWVVFKRELCKDRRLMKYYPFASHPMFPIGINTGETMQDERSLSNRFAATGPEKDIDVLWIGNLSMSNVAPPLLVSNKDWPIFYRLKGFQELQRIKEKRSDLNIVCSTDKVSRSKYLELVSRSKICVDMPGIGWLTRRFTELLLMKKCVLTIDQRVEFPYPIEEGEHYYSCGEDFSNLERKIDEILSTDTNVSRIETNLERFLDYLTPEYFASYVRNSCVNRVNEMLLNQK